jgi:hypothetical protein
VRLVPLSSEHVQGHKTLPFHVYSADGRLLLPARARLTDPRIQDRLRRQGSLFVAQADYDAWRRGMVQAVEGVVQSGDTLVKLAKARPDLIYNTVPHLPGEEWESLAAALFSALQHVGIGKPWLPRVLEVQEYARHLADWRVDDALFHFLWSSACRTAFYSARQTLRSMFLAAEVARELQWDEERIALVDKAALTMNVASWQLQDQLSRRPGPIGAEDRDKLERHATESTQMLRAAGVTDEAWLEAVQHHRDDRLARQPLSALSPGRQVAALLRRVDRYGAMLSRRHGREAHSATQAAQRACLGADGRPDEVGAMLLKALGLYPPGTFVTLASNETGIVLKRGPTPTQPMVACLVNAQGMAMGEPRLRATSQPPHAVRAALRHSQVNMDPPLEKLETLRSFLRSQAANEKFQ